MKCRANPKCKKCGKSMNIPYSYADWCYDCNEKYDKKRS